MVGMTSGYLDILGVIETFYCHDLVCVQYRRSICRSRGLFVYTKLNRRLKLCKSRSRK